MSCPSDLTLELWQAEALPPTDAYWLAPHLLACADCAARLDLLGRETAALVQGLMLNGGELTFLAELDLARHWRPARSPTVTIWLGWLALVGTLATALLWTLAEPALTPGLELANRVGLVMVLLQSGLRLAGAAGASLLTLATSPLLTYAQPALVLTALLLLFLAPRPATVLARSNELNSRGLP
jgi:hypothetical protein